MTAPLIRDTYVTNVRHALERSRDVRRVEHGGMKGLFREIFIDDLLRPLLPPDIGVGTGKIIDSMGRQSRQMDLIIYSKSILPPLMYSERDGIFPVEACLYAIEVKSTLTSTELKDAIDKFAALDELAHLRTSGGNGTQSVQWRTGSVQPAVNVVFAFESDLAPSGRSDLNRYFDMDPTARSADGNPDTYPLVPVICVVGRGYWWFSPQVPGVPKPGWYFDEATAQYDEVIDLLAGISNSLPQLTVSKGRPPFGRYITSDVGGFRPVSPG